MLNLVENKTNFNSIFLLTKFLSYAKIYQKIVTHCGAIGAVGN